MTQPQKDNIALLRHALDIDPVESAEQIRFLERIQGLLADGRFTTTYKYALLHAIADIAVQKNDWSGKPCIIEVSELAERFIELYWNQSRNHPALSSPLHQMKGGKAGVIHLLEHASNQSIHAFKARTEDWQSTHREVEKIIRRYPLQLLQVIGGEKIPFLYNIIGSGQIELCENVAFCLARFHGLITGMARTEWYRMVLRLNPALNDGGRDLHTFLFETERQNLESYRGALLEFQEGRCFYCERPIKSAKNQAAVDHFVPWSRYPWDVGHNFVLADQKCNSSKSDLLPARDHLEHWLARYRNPQEFEELLARSNLQTGKEAVLPVFAWAYAGAINRSEPLWVSAGKKNVSPDIDLVELFLSA